MQYRIYASLRKSWGIHYRARPLPKGLHDETSTARRPRARPIASAVSMPVVFLFLRWPFSLPNPPMSAVVRASRYQSPRGSYSLRASLPGGDR